MIKSYVTEQNVLVFCQGITLYYWDKPAYKDHKHLLIMNQINIIGEDAGNMCYNTDFMGIHIWISIMEYLLVVINNSLFYNLHHTAISVRSRCHGSNKMIVENSTFEHNLGTHIIGDVLFIQRPLIKLVLSHDSKSILFKHCYFKSNYNDYCVIFITIKALKSCEKKHCVGPLTNVTLVRCQFTKNIGENVLYVEGIRCRCNLFIIGPSHFVNTSILLRSNYVLHTINMVVHLIGPVTLASNSVRSVMRFVSCKLILHKDILIKSNNCKYVITLEYTYIKMMEYTNVTLLKNKHFNKLIETALKLNPLCTFQFVTLKNTPVSLTHYSVNIIDNLYIIKNPLHNIEEKKRCLFPLYHFTPHCQWLPNAAFHNYSPRVVYQQIIKIHGQNLTYHKILCHCLQNGSYNCNVDTFGPVYPGQILQVELCIPCNDGPAVLYPEVSSANLPNSACKIALYTEMNLVYNYSKPVHFTIRCELFLTIASSSHYISEAFYVHLLSCPIGFTLQNGVCNCDPIFSTYTVECYIDDSAIHRSANTWITAHT